MSTKETVNVTNVKNGKPATFTKEDWERIKVSPEFKGVFQLAKAPKEPAEVTEHKNRVASANTGSAAKAAIPEEPAKTTEAGK